MLVILHQDAHIVAVHKPAGLLVHRTPVDAREHEFALQRVRKQVGRRVYPVHRLDKGASGVLLFAFDREVATTLGGMFARHEVRKTYLAVVRGYPAERGEIDHPLTRRHEEGPRFAASQGAAREARTRFERRANVELPHCVDRYPTSRYALVELNPLTGRSHQLRRHLAHIAHPIVGDSTWGSGRHNRLFHELFGFRRLLLASVELDLAHPTTGLPLVLTAPLDGDFAEVLRRMGWTKEVPPRWLAETSAWAPP